MYCTADLDQTQAEMLDICPSTHGASVAMTLPIQVITAMPARQTLCYRTVVAALVYMQDALLSSPTCRNINRLKTTEFARS